MVHHSRTCLSDRHPRRWRNETAAGSLLQCILDQNIINTDFELRNITEFKHEFVLIWQLARHRKHGDVADFIPDTCADRFRLEWWKNVKIGHQKEKISCVAYFFGWWYTWLRWNQYILLINFRVWQRSIPEWLKCVRLLLISSTWRRQSERNIESC